MHQGDYLAIFEIIKSIIKNDNNAIDFEDVIVASSYRYDGALELLQLCVSQKILKLSGSKIILDDLGNVISFYLQRESKKESSSQ